MRWKWSMGLVTPHAVHVRSVGGWRLGRGTYVVFAAAARHGLQVFLRYRVPLVGVKSSSGLTMPQSAQICIPGGAWGFAARGGRPALARAARHGLQRVCVHG